jgi:hypothetical protein
MQFIAGLSRRPLALFLLCDSLAFYAGVCEQKGRYTYRLAGVLLKPQEVIMAKKSFLAGMLAAALVFGFAVAGCSSGSGGGGSGGGNPFVGKWRADDNTLEFKSNLTWTYTDDDESDKNANGTYTVSGNSATLKVTAAGDEIIRAMIDGQTITLTNNTFTLRGVTWTKLTG